MSYKELAEDALKSAKMLENISERMDFYSASITDLLARAEAAEKALDEEKKHRLHAEHHADAFLKDCDALNRKLIAAESRAKNAERERDAAIKELDGVSNAVGNLSDFVDDQIYPLIQYDMYAALRDNIYAITTWEKESEWSGIREE